jgi:hypothetical protein
MERKLARIEKIESLHSIEGKDFIEVACVLGWSVIVKKGEFEVGDLCIYCEPDSILPERPEFEFLRSRCWNDKWQGFRIKTMKMSGIISQGIVFPLSILDNLDKSFTEGKDVTNLVGIKKYDPEKLRETSSVQSPYKKVKNPILKFLLRFKWIRNTFFPGHKKIPFPSHLVSKTDEQRVQNVPYTLNTFKDTHCYVTEKIDGCSATYVYDNMEVPGGKNRKFLVCSRNVVVSNKNSHYHFIANKYNLKDKLRGTGYALQGEIIGPGVYNGSGINLYEVEEPELYVFNIVDTRTRKSVPLWTLINLCSDWDLNTVPVLDFNYKLGIHTVPELLTFATGKSRILPSVLREGIVIRDVNNKYQAIANIGSSLSFKVISPEFEIKYLTKDRD